jgi:hypothetical protein
MRHTLVCAARLRSIERSYLYPVETIAEFNEHYGRFSNTLSSLNIGWRRFYQFKHIFKRINYQL